MGLSECCRAILNRNRKVEIVVFTQFDRHCPPYRRYFFVNEMCTLMLCDVMFSRCAGDFIGYTADNDGLQMTL